MMRFYFLISLVVLALFACGSTGCKSEEEAGVSVAPVSESVDHDPVQQFNVILERLTRDLETDEPGVVTGFTVIEDGGRSRLSFETDVLHELFPPKKPTDTYRAVITVVTRSRYTVQLPNEEEADKKSDDKDEEEDSDADNQDDSLVQDDLGGDFSAGLFESEPAPEAESRSRPRPRMTEEVLSTPANENVQKFELAYEGEKWVLKTTPEQESIADALERALRLQY